MALSKTSMIVRRIILNGRCNVKLVGPRARPRDPKKCIMFPNENFSSSSQSSHIRKRLILCSLHSPCRNRSQAKLIFRIVIKHIHSVALVPACRGKLSHQGLIPSLRVFAMHLHLNVVKCEKIICVQCVNWAPFLRSQFNKPRKCIALNMSMARYYLVNIRRPYTFANAKLYALTALESILPLPAPDHPTPIPLTQTHTQTISPKPSRPPQDLQPHQVRALLPAVLTTSTGNFK